MNLFIPTIPIVINSQSVFTWYFHYENLTINTTLQEAHKHCMELKEAIRTYLEKKLTENGYELVNIQHEKHKKHGVKITLFIDRLDGVGITHSDCKNVTRMAQEEFELLLENYLLEVSSPGLNRPISTPEHFQRFQNRKVRLKLKNPQDDRVKISGKIVNAFDEYFCLLEDGVDETVNILYTDIQKANLLS